MKISTIYLSLIIISTLLLSSCSPHSGTGVWKATAENDWGIERLVVGFDGKAVFTSTKKNNAIWHCFWSSVNDSEDLELKCKPSTNTEHEKQFLVIVNNQGFAELRNNSSLLATFKLLDENPSPKK